MTPLFLDPLRLIVLLLILMVVVALVVYGICGIITGASGGV